MLLLAAGEAAVSKLDLHGLPRLEPLEPLERAGVFVERAVEVEDVDLFESVPFPGREVVWVVRGRDFHDAGPELRIDQLRIQDHRNQTVDEWMANELAVKVPVTLVVRMNGDCRIAEHRLGARGRDDDLAISVRQRVREIEHGAFDVFLLLDLEVGEDGLRLDVPVHQAGVSVDEPLFVESHEGLPNGAYHVGVHSELGAGPVARSAHLAKLLKNPAARLLFPLPDPLDELLAAEVLAGQPLFLELALHHHLRCDAGVVDAWNPEGVEALHSLVAAEDVLEGRPASMPHVQRAGDVGRRNRQRVRGSMVVRVLGGRKQAGGLPEVVPARLRFTRRVLLGHLVGMSAHPTDRVR